MFFGLYFDQSCSTKNTRYICFAVFPVDLIYMSRVQFPDKWYRLLYLLLLQRAAKCGLACKPYLAPPTPF